MACQETKNLYEKFIGAIKSFNHLLPDIKDKDTRAQLKTKQAEIETALKELREITTPPEIKDLVDQYERQVSILERVGILEKGKRSITGIDGVEYPLPNSIRRVLMKEKEKILKKGAQGFGQLRLVPFGMPLETLIEIYAYALKAHHRAGKLFYPKEKPEDPDEPVEFDENEPVWTADEWLDKKKPAGQRGKDISGDIVYYAEKLEKGKKGTGLTKKQVLQKQRQQKSETAGWRILMMETENVIPRSGNGKTIGGRKQIEAGKNANEYLAMLKDPKNPYEHEQSMSFEDWLVQAIVILEEKNQVLADYAGKGSFCWLPGSFNFRSGRLAFADWSRHGGRAYLSYDVPEFRNPSGVVRSAVDIC